MKTAIETNDLSHAFGGRPVLDRVSFTIAAGDFFVIIGPNGSGKTTLMKLMCGILNTGPGRIAFSGRTSAAIRTGPWRARSPMSPRRWR